MVSSVRSLKLVWYCYVLLICVNIGYLPSVLLQDVYLLSLYAELNDQMYSCTVMTIWSNGRTKKQAALTSNIPTNSSDYLP